MTYIINPTWFYWISVVSSLEVFLVIMGLLMGCVVGIVALSYMIAKENALAYPNSSRGEIAFCEFVEKKFKLKTLTIISIIFLALPTLIPSKTVMTQILVASQVTHENLAVVQESAVELIDYIVEKVNIKIGNE